MATPYGEGHLFRVPVNRSQHGVGLLARLPRRGRVLLGYFFRPGHTDLPTADWVRDLHPLHAILICRFKDTLLYKGDWHLLGVHEGFSRAAWPVPPFHRFDGSGTNAPELNTIVDYRVQYGDDDLVVPASEVPALGPDFKLDDDMVYEPEALVAELAERLSRATADVDDRAWR